MESLNWLELITLLIGTSGITGFVVSIVTIKYSRSKARSEAKAAESEAKGADAEADMKRQDYYQEIIEDMEKDRVRMKNIRDEQESYIAEIKEDRKRLHEEKEQYRKENQELQSVISELRKTQREQGDKIARLGRMQKAMVPLICTNTNCKMRQSDIMGLVSDDSFDAVEEAKKNTKKK